MRSNSAMVKSLRNQLEDVQASELSAVKAYKRLQGELEDMQAHNDELTRSKMEVRQSCACLESLLAGKWQPEPSHGPSPACK